MLFIDRGESTARARLAMIELGTGSSVELLEVPYESNRTAGLTVGPHGEVIVVANREDGVAGWMYEVVDGKSLAFVGSWSTSGALLDAPHPSRPMVVTTDGESFNVHSLERSHFVLEDELDKL